MIWIIPALVFAAGCLAVAIWALSVMYRHKRAYGIANASAAKYLAEYQEVEKERNTLRSQLNASREQVVRMMSQHDTAIIALHTERDALKLKLDEAQKPRVRGKAKMSQERGRDV